MEKKNHNSAFKWPVTIDELEALDNGKNPVDPHSWKKLEARLQDGGIWKSRLLYTAAAAVIGILLFIKFGTPDSQNQPVKGLQMDQQVNATKQPEKMIPPLNEKFVNRSQNIKPINTLPSTDKVLVKDIKRDTQMITFIEKSITNRPDSSLTFVVTNNTDKPVKKTMAIVHLNDLTDSIENTPGTTMRIKPIRRFIRGSHDEDSENAAAVNPLKKPTINKSSTIQN